MFIYLLPKYLGYVLYHTVNYNATYFTMVACLAFILLPGRGSSSRNRDLLP